MESEFSTFPDPVMHGDGRRIIFHHWADHLYGALPCREYGPAWKIEGQIVGMGPDDFPETMFRQGVNHPSNSSPIDCARAHRARLGRNIHAAILEEVRVVRSTGASGKQGFRVPYPAFNVETVLLIHKDFAIRTNENSAEGMLSIFLRTLCDGNGFLEKKKVIERTVFVHG